MNVRLGFRTLAHSISVGGALWLAGCEGNGTGPPPTAMPVGAVALVGDSQLHFPGITLLVNPVAGLVDENGVPVPQSGAEVAWSILEGDGTLQALSDTTNMQGAAAAEWTLGPNEGPNRIQAVVGAFPPVEFVARATLPGPIVFASGRRGNVGNAFEGFPADLFVMNEDGSDVIPLFGPSVSLQILSGPVWSPDGSEVAFARAIGRPAGGTPGLVLEGVHVIVMSSLGQRELPPAGGGISDLFRQPSWSRFGSGIVVQVATNGSLRTMSRTGTGIAELVTPADSAASPAFSPAEDRIAFACVTNDISDLCIINDDGTGFVNLTNGAVPADEPAWSRDGTQLLFSSEPENDGGIWRINVDGSSLEQMVTGHLTSPSWSPDGTKFVATMGANNFVESDIYVIDVATRAMTNITNTNFRDREAAWRP